MKRDYRPLRLGIRHPALAAAFALNVMRTAGPRIEHRPRRFGVLTALRAANLHLLGLFHGLYQSRSSLENKLRISGTATTISWREL